MQLITTQQAADRAGLSKSTLDHWRAQNEGPPFLRLGGPRGRVRYDVDDLERWLSRHRVDPSEPSARGRAGTPTPRARLDVTPVTRARGTNTPR